MLDVCSLLSHTQNQAQQLPTGYATAPEEQHRQRRGPQNLQQYSSRYIRTAQKRHTHF
jgi:hypothetical protein